MMKNSSDDEDEDELEDDEEDDFKPEPIKLPDAAKR